MDGCAAGLFLRRDPPTRGQIRQCLQFARRINGSSFDIHPLEQERHVFPAGLRGSRRGNRGYHIGLRQNRFRDGFSDLQGNGEGRRWREGSLLIGGEASEQHDDRDNDPPVQTERPIIPFFCRLLEHGRTDPRDIRCFTGRIVPFVPASQARFALGRLTRSMPLTCTAVSVDKRILGNTHDSRNRILRRLAPPPNLCLLEISGPF